jgi:hypothetical protein
MASASDTLAKLSVNTDDATGNQSLLMPKLQYRFRVNFIGLGDIGATNEELSLTRQVIDCARPQVQFDEITLNAYNSRVYLAGKHTWQTLAINVRDDASGLVSQAVGAQLQRQLDFYEQASAPTGSDYKFQMEIQILDGGNGVTTPNVLENWSLAGCFLQQANYQTLNYATSEAVSIAMTIRFDNAIQTNGSEGSLDSLPGAGVGQTGILTSGGATVG